jgi:hypothetical protein
MFQSPVPVAAVLEKIYHRVYVLPAIQREFVWSTDQIRMLFDSLMRGYPIGSFLFWEVSPAAAAKFSFYDFIQDYHERNHPYAEPFKIPPGEGTTAILDGQQRLTGLYIGLYGSHAERLPRRWWANPDAFPKKRLYLNLLDDPPQDELSLHFNLRFLSDHEAAPISNSPDRWFPVSEILKMEDSGPALLGYVEDRSLDRKRSFDLLHRLYRAVRDTSSINAYVESSDDIDQVLDIFVRVNSQGTPLSHSDLLLSMAVNQWKTSNAREEIRSLVSELNGSKASFNLSKDVVLKAGLALVNASDLRFRVSRSPLQARWPSNSDRDAA